jgi:hypothetical protein
MKTTISQEQYNKFRKDSEAAQPMRKQIALSELEFESLSRVTYSGMGFSLSAEALRQLLRMLRIPQATCDMLESQYGTAPTVEILNSIRSRISGSGVQVTITVSPSRVILAVDSSMGGSMISAAGFFTEFERIQNRSNHSIRSLNRDDNGGIWINTDGGQHQVGQHNDESFRTGMQISRTLEGIDVSPFLLREVCTNGMISTAAQDQYSIRANVERNWQQFRLHLESLEKRNWVPLEFDERVEQAKVTPASWAELNRYGNLITHNSSVKPEDLGQWIPNWDATIKRYKQAGLDTAAINPNQAKQLRTGANTWDCINAITDFASHNYGQELKPGADRRLQIAATNELLGTRTRRGEYQSFDMQNLVEAQPFS